MQYKEIDLVNRNTLLNFGILLVNHELRHHSCIFFQLFHQCQRCIQSIQGRSQGANKTEQVMIRNVVSSLASQVQDLSQVFKKGQSTYLKSEFHD